jgi:hypothetical protein
MNVVLIVVDSLRAPGATPDDPVARRFADLDRSMLSFDRAYSTECWTLPSHVSMFTGLLPSEHRAHFRTMRYDGERPPIACAFEAAGHHTEIITRNCVLDGTIPGVDAGFARRTKPARSLGGPNSVAMIGLTLVKPRVRRLLSQSGFFHRLQKDNVDFVMTLAQSGIPADDRAL